MSHEIAKIDFQEKVRLAYLRHRGDIALIQKDLQVNDRVLLRKIIKKFRVEMDHSVRNWVAENLYKELIFGRQSRVQNLMDMLRVLQDREQLYLSMCCDAPAEKHTEIEGYKIPDTYMCLMCHMRCEVKLTDRIHIIKTKQDILKQLLEEDDALTLFAERLGFTNLPPQELPSIGMYKPNVIVIGSGKDQKIIQDASTMSPMDREALRKELEERILEASTEDDIEIKDGERKEDKEKTK
jgi:hypothetical protein